MLGGYRILIAKLFGSKGSWVGPDDYKKAKLLFEGNRMQTNCQQVLASYSRWKTEF